VADTRVGWKTVVTPDDLDAHMREIGQVQANGELISQMFNEVRLPRGSRIYVPGAGTGQLFGFVIGWEKYDFLFTDLRSDFLSCIPKRMPQTTYFRTLVDDVENSNVDTFADVALVVLVLEHVDWKKALREILRARPRHFFIVIQRNEIAGSSVVAKRVLKPSIQRFAAVAKSELVDASALISELSSLGFKLASRSERSVPDRKTMIGLRFTHA
jgi:SAM-dependent methyltransferase